MKEVKNYHSNKNLMKWIQREIFFQKDSEYKKKLRSHCNSLLNIVDIHYLSCSFQTNMELKFEVTEWALSCIIGHNYHGLYCHGHKFSRT